MKYNIDPELYQIAKVKMPRNPKLLPLMNLVVRSFRCKSDDKVTVKRARIRGYQEAELSAYLIEPKIDKSKIFLGGDSAGGNLAASVTLMARDRGLALPEGVMLIYPVTDRRMTTASMQSFTDTPVWDARLSKMMWQCYLGDENPEHIEYASPVEALSLEHFPPTYMEVAEFDCLHDEGVILYEKIKATGAATELHEIKGGCHGYETAVNSLIVQTCMDCRIKWLRKLLKK